MFKYFKKLRYSYLIVGIFFLIISFIWVKILAPQITALNTNFSFNAEVVSIDNLYDESKGVFSGDVHSKTKYGYNVLSEKDNNLLIRNYFTVHTPADELIFHTYRDYEVDRFTGEHVQRTIDREREGYLFAPKNLESGESFTYWHVNYDAPAEMNFVKSETIDELDVFVYESRYEGQRVDQTKDLSFLPEVGETRGIFLEPYIKIWVEPTTGRLVKYEDDTTAYYYDLETGNKQNPWNRFSNTFSESSINEIVSDIKIEKTRIQFVDLYIPIILIFLSIYFLLRSISYIYSVRDNIKNPNLLIDGLAYFVCIVAGISLVGWIFGIESFVRIIPFASGMNPLTAINFVLIGLGIILRNKSFKFVFLIAVFVFVTSSLRALHIFDFIAFDIDLVLFRDAVLNFPAPARMAIYTATSFMMLSFILLISKLRALRSIHFPEILSLLAVVFSLLALSGFLFDSLEVFNLPVFFSSAVHTAVLFLISGIIYLESFRTDHKIDTKNWTSVSFVLFAIIFVTIVIATVSERILWNEARSEFELEIQSITNSIDSRMDIYINALEGGKGLFTASDFVSREEWRKYVDGLDIQENYPGIQGMGYSVFVKPEELESHIQSIRDEGFPDFTVRPEGQRELYSSIVYLEPFDIRNQQAFGFDMFSNAIRRSAMEFARDNDTPTLSGKIILVQEIDDDVQPGFLIYVPYYGNGTNYETLDERREKITGYVYSPFRARDFVEGALQEDLVKKDVGLTIYDGYVDEENILYDDLESLNISEDEARFKEVRTMYFAGRPWVFEFYSSKNFGLTIFSKTIPAIVALVGITLSILVAFIFYIILSSRKSAIDYAQKITKDLRREKEKFERMFSDAAIGIALVGLDGSWLEVNHALPKIVGYTKDELLDKTFQDITHEEDLEKDLKLVQKCIKGDIDSYDMEKRYIRKDGSVVWVLLSVSIIRDEKRKPQFFVSQIVDISHQKEVDKAKSEFVSLASHQLRTPLSSINWYSEMLIDGDAGKLNEKQKDYIDQIYVGTERMTDLVNALLDVSRLELGTFSVDPEKNNFITLIEPIIKELKQKADEKKIKIEKEFDKSVPDMDLDRRLVQIMIQNLLSNAIKYTPEGGKVKVKVEVDKKYLHMEISDNGYGIPLGQQDRIFTKLFRADNIVSLDTEGTGLGLYIVKSILDSISGTIKFTSKENEGTTFRVSIPVKGMKKKVGTRKLGS